LQTATRAFCDSRDEEYVVCALLHDIGDTLWAFNQPDIAAAILKPFISEANLWMIQYFPGLLFFMAINKPQVAAKLAGGWRTVSIGG
jgi:predicted HD phosphohydrolase